MLIDCCPKESWPELKAEYNPQGKELTLQDLTLYHVGEGHRALVLITDIFGMRSGRHRNVADLFANLGYNVFLPQLLLSVFEGIPGPGPALLQFLKNQDQAVINSKFEKLLNHLESIGIKQFLSIGFCWGTWQACRLASKYDGFIAIAGPHPSIRLQGMFGGSQIQLAERIRCPVFLLPAQNDPPNVKTNGEVISKLQQRFSSSKTLQFPDMKHGWVVRGDMGDEKVARDVKIAIQEIHKYFEQFA